MDLSQRDKEDITALLVVRLGDVLRSLTLRISLCVDTAPDSFISSAVLKEVTTLCSTLQQCSSKAHVLLCQVSHSMQ